MSINTEQLLPVWVELGEGDGSSGLSEKNINHRQQRPSIFKVIEHRVGVWSYLQCIYRWSCSWFRNCRRSTGTCRVRPDPGVQTAGDTSPHIPHSRMMAHPSASSYNNHTHRAHEQNRFVYRTNISKCNSFFKKSMDGCWISILFWVQSKKVAWLHLI